MKSRRIPTFLTVSAIRTSGFLKHPNLDNREKLTLSVCTRTRTGKYFRCTKTIHATGQRPPSVKPAFYKNPSKAIEKGGGFYIPGLRGPRLRVFVAIVASSLLSVNHIASTQTTGMLPRSFFVSEVLSLAAAASVAVSAYLDLQQARRSDVTDATESVPGPSATVSFEEDVAQTETDEALNELLSWTGNVAMDLTSVDSFTVFDGDRIAFASHAIADGRPGAAVARVAAENKALYIGDSRTLPEDVDFPFLRTTDSEEKGFCVYMVPALSGRIIAVFSAKRGTGNDLSTRDRAWLTQCVKRIEKVWS